MSWQVPGIQGVDSRTKTHVRSANTKNAVPCAECLLLCCRRIPLLHRLSAFENGFKNFVFTAAPGRAAGCRAGNNECSVQNTEDSIFLCKNLNRLNSSSTKTTDLTTQKQSSVTRSARNSGAARQANSKIGECLFLLPSSLQCALQ